jgi:hypothetical protein
MTDLENMQALAAAVTSLAGLERLLVPGGCLAGDPDVLRLADRLKRRLAVIGYRATAFQPPSIPTPAPAYPQYRPLAPVPAAPPAVTETTPAKLSAARREWEKEFLIDALGKAKGNASKMADAVGLERTAATRKLAGLGISYRDYRPRRNSSANRRIYED